MHDDVRTMFKGTAQVGCGKGIIYDKRDTGLVCNISDGTDIEHITTWVADGFTVKGTSTRRESAAVVLGVRAVDENRIDAPGSESQVELCMRAAVEAAGRDQIISRTKESHHGCHLCSHARGGGNRSCAALQRGNTLLKGGSSGVHDTSVDIAEALQSEEVGGVVCIVKDKRSCLIYRNCPGAGGWFGSLPCMDGKGVKAKDVVAVIFWHNVFVPLLNILSSFHTITCI